MTMWKPDLCIYHGGCDDGFAAAWAIWKRWPDCQFEPGVYGKPVDGDAARDKNVLFVDFSLKQDAMLVLGAAAKSIVVIDHHKTAEAELAPWAVSLANGQSATPEYLLSHIYDPARTYGAPIVAWFDMSQSGAVMAWKFGHPDAIVPTFLELVQDRDLWKFKYGEDTRKFSAALRTYPMDFKVWDKLTTSWGGLVSEGEGILRAHNANIAKFIADAYMDTIDGHLVPVVNVPYHYASDTAHALLTRFPGSPFTACWFRRGDGMIQYSLRSEDCRLDVSEIAKKFGGGGHRNAAGFQVQAYLR
jgi:oligoribonuclease NrnB/cAMP/cGMP phosphodiesterase (DHH superfamily)